MTGPGDPPRRSRAPLRLAALGLAVGAVVGLPRPSEAASAARERAALTMLGFVGGPGPPLPSRQPPPPVPLTPDAFMVIDAWRAAGIRVDRSQADYRHLEQACAIGRVPDSGSPGPDPEPGDFLLYDSSLVDPSTPAMHPRRVALFVSPAEVVYWNDRDRRVERAVAAQFLPSYRSAGQEPALVANSSTDEVCRLAAADWPGGDGATSGWHYALSDPGYIAEQHQWAAAHPRDANTSLFHPVLAVLTSVVSVVSSGLSTVVGALQTAAAWLLGHLGIPGSAALGILGLLGTEFDGRRLHRFLAGLLLLPAIAVDPRLADVAVGLLRGRSPRELHVGREGPLTRFLVGAAGAAVDILTGIEDSRQVRIGMVAFALVSDLAVFGKLAAAGRLVGAAARPLGPALARLLPAGLRLTVASGRTRWLAALRPQGALLRSLAPAVSRESLRLLKVAGDTGDLVAVRPDTVLRSLRSLARVRRVAGSTHAAAASREAALAVAAPGARAERMRAVAEAGGDALSWAWRGQSAPTDALQHLSRLASLAARDLRAGGRWRGVRLFRPAWTPVSRLLPRWTVPAVQGLGARGGLDLGRGAQLAHLHAQGRGAAQLLSGQPPPPTAAPLTPVALHLDAAVEVRRAAELRAQLASGLR